MEASFDQAPSNPRQIKWNDEKNAIIECVRDDQDERIGSRHVLNEDEKTTFSTNTPLLLGEFWCNGIFTAGYFEAGIPIDVEITTARTLDDINDAKMIYRMKTKIGSEVVKISLSPPILIWPRLFYTIYIKGLSHNHCFVSSKQNNSITLKSGANIDFHGGKIAELIYALEFNEI